jgi:hypothetical protein
MNLRNSLAAALAAIALTACASRSLETTEPCAGPSTGWKVSPEVPANATELLALESGGQPVREQLRSAISLQEVWLSEGPGRLMVCRYEANVNVCPVAMTAEFTRTSKGWSAGPVESRLCRE